MAYPQPIPPEGFTWEDYVSWEGDERYELHDGQPVMQSAPTGRHQDILVNLIGELIRLFEGRPCRPYVAPLDVRLDSAFVDPRRSRNVVQPDALLICQPNRAGKHGLIGPPDWAAEILSSNRGHDLVAKLNMYEKFGVREYWVIDPDGAVLQFALGADGRYGRPQAYEKIGRIAFSNWPEVELEFEKLFVFAADED